ELATMRRRCDSIEHPPMPTFPKPPRAEPAFAFEASRPPGPWLESTRPAELRSSSFGATLFDAAAGTAPADTAPAVSDASHAAALAGAGIAGTIFQWLQLRAKAKLPADTTARLAELQSRIRPHFLFNTLNTALSLVRLDPNRAEDVLEDLAELFRVALTDSGESVSLHDEVELAQRYLAIEQI